MDKAHKQTDDELSRIERKIFKIYKTALKENKEKSLDYFNKFRAEDDEKKKLVDSGELERKDWLKWRREKILYTPRFKNLSRIFSENLLNTNEIALAYVEGRLPKIYSLNYNWSAEQIDIATNGAVSFELVDEQLIKNLATDEGENLLPEKKLRPNKDIAWNMKNINSQVLHGILQGDSMFGIANRISNVQEMNAVQSIRAARTLVTNVENKARQDNAEKAVAKGVKMGKVWLTISDARTRKWHREAGQKYGTNDKAIPIDDYFIVGGQKMLFPADKKHGAKPANIYNCRCSTRHVVLGFESTLKNKIDQGEKIKIKAR